MVEHVRKPLIKTPAETRDIDIKLREFARYSPYVPTRASDGYADIFRRLSAVALTLYTALGGIANGVGFQ